MAKYLRAREGENRMGRFDRNIWSAGFMPENDMNNWGVVFDDEEAKDTRVRVAGGFELGVYFSGIKDALINTHIQHADAILGCVAWLTNFEILKALSQKDIVQIVVQKEDFLRPDIYPTTSFKTQLRKHYDFLRCEIDRNCMPGIISSLSVCGDPTIAPVRCVGNHNSDKSPAFPRMHHKFLLFCKNIEKTIVDEFDKKAYSFPTIEPYGVWTGSFNLTENATKSLENVIYTEHPDIVSAYFTEYAHIFALSEPLNWDTEWAAPEYRIGT